MASMQVDAPSTFFVRSRLVTILSSYSPIAIVIGAIAMVATYPGRSHGIGMYTEPLLKDLALSSNDGRVTFSVLSFWATIIGSSFCIPIGFMLNRFGQRIVLMLNFACLGLGVLALSYAWNLTTLFVGLLLTRGFGQAALSVVSISIVSGSHQRAQLGMAMAVYAALSLPFHLLLIKLVGVGLNDLDWSWRTVSSVSGLVILGLIAVAMLLPKRAKFAGENSSRTETVPMGLLKSVSARGCKDLTGDATIVDGMPLRLAVRTGSFWAFSITISLWGMIYAGSSLFNQDIFKERGFGKELYFEIMSYTAIVGLFSKFAFGWLNNRAKLNHLLAITMLLTSLSLMGLPFATETWHAYLYATAGGVASGGVALLFFSCWGTLFGHRDLARIQGLAQMLTVFASALGPVLFAWIKQQTNSYVTVFFGLSGLAFLLSFWAFFVPLPKGDEHGNNASDC